MLSSETQTRSRLDLDRVGACASAICAVHCLLSGVALSLLSVLGLGFIASGPSEIAFIGVTLVVGSTAVFIGHRKHRSLLPAVIYLVGLLAILGSHTLLNHDTPIGTTASVLGGLCFVTFHLVNQRLIRARAGSPRAHLCC